MVILTGSSKNTLLPLNSKRRATVYSKLENSLTWTQEHQRFPPLLRLQNINMMLTLEAQLIILAMVSTHTLSSLSAPIDKLGGLKLRGLLIRASIPKKTSIVKIFMNLKKWSRNDF